MSALAEWEASRDEADRRITLQQQDLKADQELSYSNSQWGGLRHERSLYKVLVDGQWRAVLVCRAGWGKGWKIYSLHHFTRSPVGKIDSRVLIVAKDKALSLANWLADNFDRAPQKWPTIDGIEAERKTREADREAQEAETAKWREERAAARAERKRKAGEALGPLRQVTRRLDLDAEETAALLFAFEVVNKLANARE